MAEDIFCLQKVEPWPVTDKSHVQMKVSVRTNKSAAQADITSQVKSDADVTVCGKSKSCENGFITAAQTPLQNGRMVLRSCSLSNTNLDGSPELTAAFADAPCAATYKEDASQQPTLGVRHKALLPTGRITYSTPYWV